MNCSLITMYYIIRIVYNWFLHAAKFTIWFICTTWQNSLLLYTTIFATDVYIQHDLFGFHIWPGHFFLGVRGVTASRNLFKEINFKEKERNFQNYIIYLYLKISTYTIVMKWQNSDSEVLHLEYLFFINGCFLPSAIRYIFFQKTQTTCVWHDYIIYFIYDKIYYMILTRCLI